MVLILHNRNTITTGLKIEIMPKKFWYYYHHQVVI